MFRSRYKPMRRSFGSSASQHFEDVQKQMIERGKQGLLKKSPEEKSERRNIMKNIKRQRFEGKMARMAERMKQAEKAKADKEFWSKYKWKGNPKTKGNY